MCLISSFEKPLIAKRDIKVYKLVKDVNKIKWSNDGYFEACNEQLIINDINSQYVTPYQYIPINLGDTLKGSDEYTDKYNAEIHRRMITDGYVHGYTYYSCVETDIITTYLNAVIPQGSEYYVDVTFNEICSKELKIIDEVDYSAKTSDFTLPDELKEEFFDLIDRNNISPGWIMIGKDNFVHPAAFDKTTMTAIGVVGGVKEKRTFGGYTVKDITVVALREFFKSYYNDDLPDENVDKEEIKSVIRKTSDVWCCVNNYQTEYTTPGDWHLGGKDEWQMVLTENMTYINFSIRILAETYTNITWLCGFYATNGIVITTLANNKQIIETLMANAFVGENAIKLSHFSATYLRRVLKTRPFMTVTITEK